MKKRLKGLLLAVATVAFASALAVPAMAWADDDLGAKGDDDSVAYAIPEGTEYTTVSNADELKAALNSKAAVILLKDGEYNWSGTGHNGTAQTVSIYGESKNAVLYHTNEGEGGTDYDFDGYTVNFYGLTISGENNVASYPGWARMSATYNDCVVKQTYGLYAGTHEFNYCTLDVTGDQYNVWTWGAENATFDHCTFSSDGKAILLYGTENTNLVVENCTFNDKGGLSDKKAAIEIGNDYGKSYTLTVNNTTVIGYEVNDKGINTGTTLWANKNSMSGESLTVVVGGKQVYPEVVATVNGENYSSLQAALNAAAAASGEVTVEILDNVNLTGIGWEPVTVSGPGYPMVTVNGNNHVITGLNDMLFAGTWAGKSGLVINDLTIKESTIVNDKDDSKGTVGVGAFIGFPQASAVIALNNCHLINSHVEGGHWTGGLIGYAAGYAGTDGPVFMDLTIANCSVTGSTVTGKGSAGGVLGHGSGNGWTNVVIKDTTVSGNTITSTGSSTNKAGSIMGTIGAAGQATTVNGVTKTGGAFVSATTSDNKVSSNGTAITTIYGRQGTNTGVLTLTAGGSYDAYPIEKDADYALVVEGHAVAGNDSGTYSVLPAAAAVNGKHFATLKEALDAAGSSDTVTILKNATIDSGSYDEAFAVADGVKLVITGGTFASDPGEFVSSGYYASKNADGTWTVRPIPYIPPADPLPETGCDDDAACNAFNDVDAGAWYHEFVDWAVENGILRGYDDGSGNLGPEDTTLRAHVMVMLHRMAGEPEPAAAAAFNDVKAGAWYSDAVAWAAETGLTTGYTDGSGDFGPADVMTREQMATVLYRFAVLMGYDVSAGEDTNILSYEDFGDISEYAIPAMQWAVGSGIIGGYTDADGEPTGFLGPKDDAERAHFAAMLMRMDEAYGIL